MRRRIAHVAVGALLAGGVIGALAAPAPAGINAPITVTKVVSGTEPFAPTYVIHIACIGTAPFVGNNPTADLTFFAGGGSQQFNGIVSGYEGNCTFTETNTGGATSVTYACSEASGQPPSAATCGGGGASPSTLNINDPSAAQLATITVTDTFAAPTPVVTSPTQLTG
jgi:hypothetical protein